MGHLHPGKWSGRRFAAILAAAVLCGQASAQDRVAAEGKLDDQAFYRLIACGAPPRGECTNKLLKWPENARRDLTVGIVAIEGGYSQRDVDQVTKFLKDAIQQINGVGADVHLRLVSGTRPNISVRLADTRGKRLMNATNDWSTEIEQFAAAAFFRIDYNTRTGAIQAATISLGSEMDRRSLRSVVLEELVQSLGLVKDVDGKYYSRRSIFAEGANRITKLEGQDARVLLMHYPKRN